MFQIIRILGAAVVLLISSRSFANADVYYDCNLVIETKDASGGWSIEASPHKKFGPVPTSRATLAGELIFKDYSGQIEIIVARPQAGRVLLRVQKIAQTIPSGYAYADLFAENIETGSELSEDEIVRMSCRQE